MASENLANRISEKIKSLGIRFAGIVPASKWEGRTDVAAEQTPNRLWPLTRSVIVLGDPFVPDIALQSAAGDVLDEAAYKLALFLNGLGFPSVYIPSDSSGEYVKGYAKIPVFDHNLAAQLAGFAGTNLNGGLVHTISGCLLRAASVFTSLELEDALLFPYSNAYDHEVQELNKKRITELTKDSGIKYVGFAPVSRWQCINSHPGFIHPQDILPAAKTVIVLGSPLWLPVVESSPSEMGLDQVKIVYSMLKRAAYDLSSVLYLAGYTTRYHTARLDEPARRDGSPEFSDDRAGFFAGLGTLGWSGHLLTKEYGPRLLLACVITDCPFEGDPLISEDLCRKCLLCKKICPVNTFTDKPEAKAAHKDSSACRCYESILQKAYIHPCSACIKVCPIGKDRQAFHSCDLSKYLNEKDHPDSKECASWLHIRRYGGYPLETFYSQKDNKE